MTSQNGTHPSPAHAAKAAAASPKPGPVKAGSAKAGSANPGPAKGEPTKAGAPALGDAGAGKTVSAILGEITWLMSQSARHKTFMIGDLEALVMPAILLRQFRLYYETPQLPPGSPVMPVTQPAAASQAPASQAPASQTPAQQVPVGVVLFARVTPETAARLDAGAPSLRPGDWNGGSTIRIIDIIAPFGGRDEMAKEFLGAGR